MSKAVCLLVAGLAIAAGLPARAADGGVGGNYILVYYPGASEGPLALVKLEDKDGKLVGTILDGKVIGAKGIKQASQDGKLLHFELEGGTAIRFEGMTGAAEIPGSIQFGSNVVPAKLIKTTDEELTQARPKRLEVPEFIRANQEAAKVNQLRAKVRREKNAEKKAELRKEVEEAKEKASPEEAKLYREVLQKYADSPVVIASCVELLRNDKAKPTADEARKWIETVSAFAAKHGPRLESETRIQIADALAGNKDLKDLALEKAQSVDAKLANSPATEDRARAKKILLKALQTNSKADEAKAAEADLAKLDKILDTEYLAKVPPFKPQAFAGREQKGDRKVVMELFTGAECPPCVAADVAFDALAKSFKPSELILLQYHLHIPRPDPLTNADTEARADYYKIGGTPSTRFNGKTKRELQGGGGMDAAETLYSNYLKVIKPSLEETGEGKLTLSATQVGDKINIKAGVSGLKEPGEKRLRLLLVEETIPYVGGNKLRFHHHVVRDLPGGPDGFELKEGNSQYTASVNLDELRGKINKYLDTYVKENDAEFASQRPKLDFKHLKVVGLVQDDKTKEILQVIQADIAGELTTSAAH